MSDNIVRTTVEENDANIIKHQVMNDTTDGIIRHQVRGLDQPAPEPPVLETLNVTENGTYTPEEGVDGFDEVIVEVPAPTINQLISKIKVVDVEGTKTIKDVIRDLTISGNQLTNDGTNIVFNRDRNANMVTNVTQMNEVPYVLEADIVSVPDITTIPDYSDSGNNYLSFFTFGTNKSTLWGLFYDKNNASAEPNEFWRCRTQNNTQTDMAVTADTELSNLEGKTIKLYINCLLTNNEITYTKNKFIFMINDAVVMSGDFANYAGANWDQMCNMGWSSYKWGCCDVKISEFRCKVLNNILSEV